MSRPGLLAAWLLALALGVPAAASPDALSDAIRRGDIRAAQAAIEEGVDPNELGERGESVLVDAVVHARTAIVDLLLEHGADPNARAPSGPESGIPVVHLAARGSTYTILLELLRHGADPNARNSRGQTPLFASAARGDADAVEALLAHGADPTLQDAEGTTAYAWARGHAAVQKILAAAAATRGAEGKERHGEWTFSDLAPNEEVAVDYSSATSAKTVGYRLLFTKGRHGMRVVESSLDSGSLILDEDDPAALDRLLALYRGGTQKQCERIDHIHVVWKRNGVTESEETFDDQSCRPEATCGVLPLSAIGALVLGETPPPNRSGNACDVRQAAKATLDTFAEMLELLGRKGDGLATFFGLALLFAFGLVFLLATAPLVVGLILGRKILGLAAFAATLIASAVLIPYLGFLRAPALVGAVFTLGIVALRYRDQRSRGA